MRAQNTMSWGSLLLVAGLLAGCPGDTSQGYRTCNPACPRGTVCNNATGTCVTVDSSTPPPTQCTGRMIPCDNGCVDPFADPANCGACGNACSAAAECLNGHCSCLTNKHNCNNSWADGCECDVGCADTACATGGTSCDPNVAWSCGANDTQKWCDAGTCKSCSGAFNCDGLGNCENPVACGGGTTCSASTKFHCGSESMWCDAGTCRDCSAGTLNCDGVNACELTGSSCATTTTCSPSTAFVCGDNTRWCDGSSCADCAAGKVNCDGKNDCEASTCAAPECSATTAFSCGAGDTTKWCDNGDCKTCTGTYTRNCDGLGSCDSTGDCCKPTVVGACGGSDRWCNNGSCAECAAGKYNCDRLYDCEASAVCGSTGCTWYGATGCNNQSQYCDAADAGSTGTCRACPSGTYNCLATGNTCSCTTSCNGTSCVPECTLAGGCGNTTQYCSAGKCVSCASGWANCDKAGYCDCEGTCSGATCVGSATCDYYQTPQNCKDASEWCYQAVCKVCSTGSYNCNRTMGCECTKTGGCTSATDCCNGTACRYTCSGGECT